MTTRPKDAADLAVLPGGLLKLRALGETGGTPPPADVEPYHPRPSDTGNADLFARLHGADLRHVHDSGEWMVWDGRRWTPDRTGDVLRRAEATVRHLYDLAADPRHPDRREAARWAARSDDRRRLSAMVDLARHRLASLPEEYDRDPWSLTCANGTIDLRTGELRPHRREDLITRLAPVAYDPAAQSPRWDQFVVEIMAGDTELAAFLGRLAGYAVAGVTPEAVLPVLWGAGENGKSVLRETLGRILGDYCQVMQTESLLAQRTTTAGAARPDLVRLRGARLVFGSEVPEGRHLAEQLIKDLTGGDTVAARGLYERREVELRPTWSIWLAGNHRPRIRGTDRGIWRRVALIPFRVTFAPGDPRRDPDLRETLLAEAPGILAWLVRGCLAWQRDGLRLPAAVQAATEEYRTAEDVVGAWLAECCEDDERGHATATALLSSYNRWAGANAEKEVSGRGLAQRLAERGYVRHRARAGTEWWGLRLLEGP